MKSLLTLKKLILLSGITILMFGSCQKEENLISPEDSTVDLSDTSIPKSKEVYGMLVVDSSIIFNSETLSLLDSANESELIFRQRPAQADSMGQGFVMVTSTVNSKLPSGLLVRSLGVTEESGSFRVKVEQAELTDYVLLAELKGTVAFDSDRSIAPEAYIVQRDGQGEDLTATGQTRMPSLSQSARVPRANAKMVGGTINGPTVDLSFPFTIVSGSQAVLDLSAQPSINYDISINAWRGQFNMSFGGNLAINNLGLTLTARAPLEINFNGDEVFVPIPVPIGPILITPYFSVTPYLQAGVAGTGTAKFTSSGNIGFNFTQSGIRPGGSANVDYQIHRPDFDLYVDGTLSTGVQATVGVGLYGKTVYAQVQSKIGPKLVMQNDLLARETRVNATLPASITASAGASVLFFNIANVNYPLFEGNVLSREWTYDWPF